jgi:hypothetical protein
MLGELARQRPSKVDVLFSYLYFVTQKTAFYRLRLFSADCRETSTKLSTSFPVFLGLIWLISERMIDEGPARAVLIQS